MGQYFSQKPLFTLFLRIWLALLLQYHYSNGFASSYEPDCNIHIVGYYPDSDALMLPVSAIRYDKLTEIIYFSIIPEEGGTLDTSRIDNTRQQELVTTAHSHGVDIRICVGGWGRSAAFSLIAANPAFRLTFVTNLTQYCLDNDLDGVDLDWEPVTNSEDRNNYSLLIRDLKNSLSQHGKILSVAVAALGNEFDASTIPYVDYLHVMAYDMGTPHSTYEDALEALEHWGTFGFQRSKILLGVPFYGRDSIWQSYLYRFIIETYKPDPWEDWINDINFNGIYTIQVKTEYVLNNGYGGIMIWELPGDTKDDTSLLSTITDIIKYNSRPDYNCDGIVDGLDLGHFAVYWLLHDCETYNVWCAAADLDQSQVVNSQDLAIFARYWTSECARFIPGDFEPDCDVDLHDLSILADAWLSTVGQSNWNSSCDISMSKDLVINLLDLAVLANNWTSEIP